MSTESLIRTRGLVKADTFGTHDVEEHRVCNRCIRPLELVDVGAVARSCLEPGSHQRGLAALPQ